MSAQITFLSGNGIGNIQALSGSGLGFYGSAGFGASVQVGSWQGRTFITDGTGSNQGPEVGNTQYLNSGSGILGQTGSGVALRCFPNWQCPLNIRFTYDTPVQAIDAQVQIYDRYSPNNPASGVTTAVAQVIHPDITQGNLGSGDTTWWFPGGSGVVVPLCPSPGTSGQYAGNGSNSTRPDTEHDWYLAISASPNSIGSKSQYGLYVTTEYL